MILCWLYIAQALVSFKQYMPPPLPYFKVNICPFPLPHFDSIFFTYLWSLTQLYRYTPEIFLFSTATFKYTYRDPLRRIGQEYSANVAFSTYTYSIMSIVTSKLNFYFQAKLVNNYIYIRIQFCIMFAHPRPRISN
jgi:hypothetical protein